MNATGDSQLKYRRILLKLSGEALMGDQGYGIDPAIIKRLAVEIEEIVKKGIGIALVIGGGNIVRGGTLAAGGMERTAADQMGMLATVINALSMQSGLEQEGVDCRVMSALPIRQICEEHDRRKAIRHLEAGRVVIFAAGTGNPFFTTDSAATLRGIEIGADLILKATKVDGVYSADPVTDPSAQRFSELSFDEVINRQLGVMDLTAMVLCKEHNMPLRVFNMGKQGALMRILGGAGEGTLVSNEATDMSGVD